MFWFVFISIILFILFLIVILVSSRSSNDKTLKRLKEELEAKNRGYEKQKTPEKIKPKQAEPIQQREEPRGIEAVAVATEELAVVEEPYIQKEEPSVIEETVLQEEVAADIIEEFIEENNEVVSAEVPFVDEGVEEESSDVAGIPVPESAEEPEELSIEELTPTIEPVVEEAAVEEEPAEAKLSEPKEPSAPLEEPFIAEEEDLQPTTEEFIEEVLTEVEAEEEAIQEEPVSEEPLLPPEEIAEEDTYNYPPFDNTRAMEEFGLPQEDADEFIIDLIQQIEEEMPALEVAVQAQDSKKIEDISHMIKGSATNLGTGGAADVLIDFNTYMKTGNDPLIIAGHMRNLHRSLAELKEQFQ